MEQSENLECPNVGLVGITMKKSPHGISDKSLDLLYKDLAVLKPGSNHIWALTHYPELYSTSTPTSGGLSQSLSVSIHLRRTPKISIWCTCGSSWVSRICSSMFSPYNHMNGMLSREASSESERCAILYLGDMAAQSCYLRHWDRIAVRRYSCSATIDWPLLFRAFMPNHDS